jgi:hypothetical protein
MKQPKRMSAEGTSASCFRAKRGNTPSVSEEHRVIIGVENVTLHNVQKNVSINIMY